MLVAVAMMSAIGPKWTSTTPLGCRRCRTRTRIRSRNNRARALSWPAAHSARRALQHVGNTVPIVFVGDDGHTDEARRPDRVHDSTRPGRGICREFGAIRRARNGHRRSADQRVESGGLVSYGAPADQRHSSRGRAKRSRVIFRSSSPPNSNSLST